MDQMPDTSETEKPFQNVSQAPRPLSKREWGKVAKNMGMVAFLFTGGIASEGAKQHIIENYPHLVAQRARPTVKDVCVARGPDRQTYVDVDMSWFLNTTKDFSQFQKEMPDSVLINYWGEYTIRCNYRPANVAQPTVQASQEQVTHSSRVPLPPVITKQKKVPEHKPQQQRSAWNEWGNDAFK